MIKKAYVLPNIDKWKAGGVGIKVILSVEISLINFRLAYFRDRPSRIFQYKSDQSYFLVKVLPHERLSTQCFLLLMNRWCRVCNLFSIYKSHFVFAETILTTESPLKMKIALKSLFVLKIFKFLSWLFGYAERELDLKNKVNFKIYDIITWETNNCIKH